MTLRFTVLALTAFAGILRCDSKSMVMLKTIQQNLKSDHGTWKSQGWNATVKGTLGMTLLSHYKIPFNVAINSKNGQHKIYSDCSELKKNTVGLRSGVYQIRPQRKIYQVYCDMETNGGGWTVFQRRFNGSVDFYRTWNDYKKGFGNPGGEYWLGNDVIHELTSEGGYQLRVELTSLSNVKKYAEYEKFTLGAESTGYRLSVGGYRGTAGDSMARQNGSKFTTKDRDNDIISKNCAIYYRAAWWYNNCYYSNLNGNYPTGGKSKKDKGIVWYHFGNSYTENMKRTKMMIKKE